MADEKLLKQMNEFGRHFLPGLFEMRFTDFGEGFVEAELDVKPQVMAPNGFLHAGTIISLADSACGYGCIQSLPKGAQSFTTIELKSNFLGTAREGMIECRAELQHGGRTTQIWDATVKHRQTDKTVALFRCTQMILWPKTETK